MPARWWHRFRVARRTGIGLAVLACLMVVVVVGGAWRASWIIRQLLREWATETIARQSGGVYRLYLGQVHFGWSLRRVAVDSISLETRRGINARRAQSLPGLRVTLSDCTINGVQVVKLVWNRGLIAESFSCRVGSMAIEIPHVVRAGEPGPRGNPSTPGRAFNERQAFLVFQQGVKLPSYAPRVRIAQLVMPRLALDVRFSRTGGGRIRLELERLQWRMADVVIDPTDSTAASWPLFSRSIELVASNFITHPDSITAIEVGLLRTSLTDSTLDIRDVTYAPTGTRAEFVGSQPIRRDLVKLAVGHISAQGIDVGAFIVGEGVRARRVQVDSLRIDVTSDKRLPEGPVGPRRLTPQQWIADLDETLALDSLHVRDGSIIYQEHAAGRARRGVFTFNRIEASAVNVTHYIGRHTSGDPMILTARTHIQDVGQLDVRVVMPLDAPQFDMTFRGTLGAMPAAALNPFLVETGAVQIESGQVDGVVFDVVVKGGVARGSITPRFNDLSVSVTREGSDGILGGGGIFSGAARSIANFAAKLMLRANNPSSTKAEPRAGMIRHSMTPDQTLIAFLWLSVRDGLLSVLKK